MDQGTERAIYELNTEKVQSRTRIITAITICTAIVAILYILVNRPPSPPSPPVVRMTVEECKTLCGEIGIRKLTDDGCICVEPPETAKVPLHCTCQ